MRTDTPAHGLWSLVVINAAVFIIFASWVPGEGGPVDWELGLWVAIWLPPTSALLTLSFLGGSAWRRPPRPCGI